MAMPMASFIKIGVLLYPLITEPIVHPVVANISRMSGNIGLQPLLPELSVFVQIRKLKKQFYSGA